MNLILTPEQVEHLENKMSVYLTKTGSDYLAYCLSDASKVPQPIPLELKERTWLDRAHMFFLRGLKDLGLSDGEPGWIEHLDEDLVTPRKDSFSLEGEIYFGFEAIKDHIAQLTTLNTHHESLRDQIGEVLSETINAGEKPMDTFDSREIDILADAVIMLLRKKYPDLPAPKEGNEHTD
jgi:hypothetical protein